MPETAYSSLLLGGTVGSTAAAGVAIVTVPALQVGDIVDEIIVDVSNASDADATATRHTLEVRANNNVPATAEIARNGVAVLGPALVTADPLPVAGIGPIINVCYRRIPCFFEVNQQTRNVSVLLTNGHAAAVFNGSVWVKVFRPSKK